MGKVSDKKDVDRFSSAFVYHWKLGGEGKFVRVTSGKWTKEKHLFILCLEYEYVFLVTSNSRDWLLQLFQQSFGQIQSRSERQGAILFA
jgi:hypothetical protein